MTQLIILLLTITLAFCITFLFMGAYILCIKSKLVSLEKAINHYDEYVGTLIDLAIKAETVKQENVKYTPPVEPPTNVISYKDAKKINWKEVKFK